MRALLDPYSDVESVHITQTTKEHPFYHHISAYELEVEFKNRGWDFASYTKFCVIRNPYDRVVSLYHHHLKHMAARDPATAEPSFRQYVEKLKPKNRLPTNLEAFTCDPSGRSLVDRVLTFETLSRDVPDLLNEIGVPAAQEDLQHLNSSTNRKAYRSYYDDDLKERVAQLYSADIARFGYAF